MPRLSNAHADGAMQSHFKRHTVSQSSNRERALRLRSMTFWTRSSVTLRSARTRRSRCSALL